MKLWEIRQYPRSTIEFVEQHPERKGAEVGESCFRCYHTLQQVKVWLEDGVPAATILELVAELED